MSTFRSIKEQLRKHLGQRGIRGLVHLKKVFVDGDADLDGQLTFEEFASVLRDFGLGLSSHEMRILFLSVDKNHNERVDINEFINLIRGTVSQRRQEMITQIFRLLDRDRDGLISMMDIGACLNPKGYPEVAEGRMSSQRFLDDFLNTIQMVVKNGFLTLPDFVDYIASAFAFNSDEQVLTIMSSLWKTKKEGGHRPSNKTASGRTLASLSAETTAMALQPVLDKFRAQLARFGVRGIVTIGRKFRIIDDDNSGSLSLSEFCKCIKECGLDLSTDDATTLFKYLDEDENGHIDYEEFLHMVRGPMNSRRREMVQLAFRTLDRDGNGRVTAEDLVGAYDASKHPDVLAQRKTPDEVLREFLDTFDVGGEKDGRVNESEFEHYYENVSCFIDDDDYFELMIRNAWHISGGEGWAANTANRRVLVTDAQGNERVEEVRNDLHVLPRQPTSKSSGKTLATVNEALPQRTRPQALAAAMGMVDTSEPSPAAGGLSGLSIVEKIVATQGPRNAAASGAGSASAPTRPVPPRQQTNPGVALIIKKLKAALAVRGAKGIIGLSRRFRIMDDDNDGRLSMAEFKKAVKEVLLGISDQDICLLFKYMDPNSSGYISYESFLTGIREPLNERRLALVKSAFARLDRDGSGVIDATEIAQAYTAAKHPDVMSGKKAAEEVYREFLDTFEVGGVKDGKCTLAEFIAYYNNVSMSIDSDDYFELCIRNSWHLPGGQGWSENSANLRVLVTHSDGHQSVEEVKDDLGIARDSKVEVMKRLKSQGLNVLDVSPADGVETKIRRSKGGPQAPWRPQVQGLQDLPEPPVQPVKKEEDDSLVPPPPPKARKSKLDPFEPERGLNPGILSIVQRLKEQLKAKGAKGFIGLQRKFRIVDDDNDKQISLAELKKVLFECDLSLSDKDARLLFSHFDKDGSRTISYEEFLRGVRDPMNARRLTLVRLAFQRIDLDGDGVVKPEEVANRYDASRHPEVIAGRQTVTEVLKDFLESFDASHNGTVTLSDFVEFYQSISSSIDSDAYFELMIRNAWHISGGAGWSANSVNKRVLVTHSDGKRTVEMLQDNMGLALNDKQAVLDALRNQGIEAVDVVCYEGSSDPGLTSKKKREQGELVRKTGKKAAHSAWTCARVSAPAGVLPGTVEASASPEATTHTDHSQDLHNAVITSGSSGPPKRAPPGIQAILDRVKVEVKKRGARGVVGLSRRFKAMDTDHSGRLTLAEFRKGMEELGLGLQGAELRILFQYFDVNSEGSISLERFLVAIQGEMNEARVKLVRQAFATLDTDRDGIVSPQELVTRYDASKHPEVIAGRKTSEQIMLEFLETFDVGGQVDGKVTFGEFLNYYKGVSCSVDQDAYFELLMRNAWHLSGGEEWWTDSASRRVLVKHRDGRETVEELEEDVGISPDNRLLIIKRLQERDINAIDVNLGQVDQGEGEDPIKGSSHHQPQSLASVQRIKKAAITASGGSAVGGPYKAVDRGAMASSHAMKDSLRSPAPQTQRKPGRDEPSISVRHSLELIKQQLMARGSTGFLGLMRKFRIMDDDDSKSLSRAEFKKGLRESGVTITDKELDELFTYFDVNADETVSIEEFVQALRKPLNERRRRIVEASFAVLDKKGQGMVDVETIKDNYDAFHIPEVIAGKKSADEVYREFLEHFEVGGEVDGKVTYQEFLNYYDKLAVSVDDDDYFELLCRNAWHITGGEGWSANSANRRVVCTDPQGNQYIEEIKNDLGIKPGDVEGVKRALRQQGAQASTINLAWADKGGNAPVEAVVGPRKGRVQGGHLISHFNLGSSGLEVVTTKPPPPPRSRKVFQYDASESHIGALLGSESKAKNNTPSVQASPPAPPPLPASNMAAAAVRVAGSTSLASLSSKGAAIALLDTLRDKLKARGITGILALGRRFRIMDDDRSRTISLEEFMKAWRELGLVLSKEDGDLLFGEFDHDHSGAVDYEEFLKTLRGTLSPRRQLLVQMAFNLLDRDQDGEVSASEVASVYDPHRHPEVLAGTRSPNDVLREFFDSFEVGGTKDGVVTRKEFENYYASISASIDDDDYFELLMRNAWHISGDNNNNHHPAVERMLGAADGLGVKYRGKNSNSDNLQRSLRASNTAAGAKAIASHHKARPNNPTFQSTFTLG